MAVALLSQGNAAERQYQEAIAHLSAAPAGTDLARAHLLYGEWLRSENRRGDAREHLQAAHELVRSMEIGVLADRTERELAAAGARGAKPPRNPCAGDTLTAQEAQVARLACDGLSNKEIGIQLFISPRTVQYHLRKVFAKLGITSRGQLHTALSLRRAPASAGPVAIAS